MVHIHTPYYIGVIIGKTPWPQASKKKMDAQLCFYYYLQRQFILGEIRVELRKLPYAKRQWCDACTHIFAVAQDTTFGDHVMGVNMFGRVRRSSYLRQADF
jgi:hypothetical protein